jgi:hypothetical protein
MECTYCRPLSSIPRLLKARGSVDGVSQVLSRHQIRVGVVVDDRLIVTVDAGTVTGRDLPLSMKDLQKGRSVETIGLNLPDGTIAATRVIVSVNGRPVDMPPNAVIRDSQENPVRK